MSRISIDAGLKYRGPGGEGGGAFYPTDIDGCVLWLDSSDAASFSYSSGSVVSQWNDKSGNACHWNQSTVANQPNRNGSQNTLDTVVFNIDDFLLHSGLITNQPNTILVAVKYTGPFSNYQFIFDGQTNAQQFIYMQQRYHYGAPTDADTGDVATGAWEILTAVMNGASSQLRRNSTQIHTHNAGAQPWGNVGKTSCFGGCSSDSSLCWRGEISEAIVYDTALSVGDIDTVELYLSNRWS